MIRPQTALVAHTKWYMRRMSKASLSAQGWNVICAASADEALGVLDRVTVQMIAVEKSMKDSGGRRMRDVLRSHPRAIGAQILEIGANPLFPGLDQPKERFLGRQ